MSVVESNKGSDPRIIFAMCITMLIWGASWISGKIIADIAPPKLTVFYRLALASVSMLPILYVMYALKIVTFKYTHKALIWSLPAGVLLATYNQLFFLGLVDGLAGKGGMLVTTANPIFTFLLSALIYKERTNVTQKYGLFLGLLGGLCMLEIWQFSLHELVATGNAYFILSALAWAVLTLVSKKGTEFADFLLFSSLMYIWATFISYVFAFEHSPIASIGDYSLNYWLHMVFLSVVVISIATSMFFLGTKKLGASRSSSFVFIVPTTAMGLSVWYFNEVISSSTLIGGMLAMGAIYLINKTTR